MLCHASGMLSLGVADQVWKPFHVSPPLHYLQTSCAHVQGEEGVPGARQIPAAYYEDSGREMGQSFDGGRGMGRGGGGARGAAGAAGGGSSPGAA